MESGGAAIANAVEWFTAVANDDRFRWDPADPTPDYGGAMLEAKLSGRMEQAEREARPNVVHTSERLGAPFEVIGPVSATTRARTSAPFSDVFVRLCDVDANGTSLNVCDGIQRLDALSAPDEDGVRAVFVRMCSTAYRFEREHRLRVQVCGGSFPHFARNTGSGEPLGEATTFVPVNFEVLGGSSLTLPKAPIDGAD
ncbi:CocE/NonD family hydrolase [Mycobacteroides salmoniphilum]|uniref:CocE/NonD family hydrolase n=1 Tax=Mycobacteroides salmoniphilum TaxID=404941 RepID=UPI0010669EBF|nr:CocE/NonD family hydrolase [Mycobacteroides salmoniphilum]TDZ76893.1 Cocaine esterase [Mycobacteroides salmoniphilum]TDZ86596.1 Cocaine esterase [Mycobacteroides salmoniphilum]